MNHKRIILVFIAIMALLQFIRIDTTNPEINNEKEYINITNAPKEISNILKTSCYDCHSYETNYPWYSEIAPISWLLKHHIDEGREHLNFSEWGDYSFEKKLALQEECIKELKKNKMPLKSYTLLHANANLSDDNKTALIKWISIIRKRD